MTPLNPTFVFEYVSSLSILNINLNYIFQKFTDYYRLILKGHFVSFLSFNIKILTDNVEPLCIRLMEMSTNINRVLTTYTHF